MKGYNLECWVFLTHIYLGKKNGKTNIAPDLLAHYRIKVITMVLYSKAHSKGKVHKNKTEFSINGTTEKQHIPDLVEAFSQKNGGF